MQWHTRHHDTGQLPVMLEQHMQSRRQRVCMRFLSIVLPAILLLAACVTVLEDGTAVSPTPTPPLLPPEGLPWGVAAGDVDQTTAVLWTRSAFSGVVTFTLAAEASAGISPITRTVIDPALPVTVTLTDLTPGTSYTYLVTAPNRDSIGGQFRTAASGHSDTGLRFGVSGDWHSELRPFVSIANAPARELDFFVALGDTVYADFRSAAVPKQAQTLDEFRTKHAEVYASRYDRNPLAALRAATAWFATIDDHEILNNFAGGAPADSTPYFGEQTGLVNQARLYREGMQAFFEYNPLHATRYSGDAETDRFAERPRLYRYRTFGDDAALFVLDMRSFRDNSLDKPDPDDPDAVAAFVAASFAPDRTLLGQDQLTRLQEDLLAAQQAGVTWKFIANPDPIQHLDMISPYDRFQGYAAERARLLDFIQTQGIDNVVFVAADIHGTLVNEVYQQRSADAPLTPTGAWEITVGPVALFAPYGPTKISIYEEYGLMTAAEVDAYRALPVHNDAGDDLSQDADDRDDFVKRLLDEQLVRWGYDPIGLDAEKVDAELVAGDYAALHSFGWTEFEIDAETHELTVITYGIAPYSTRAMAEEPDGILARSPEIVSQFIVQPQ